MPNNSVMAGVSRVQAPLYKGSYALVIGISDYTSGWNDLPGVKKDRKSLAKTLNMAGFHVESVNDPDKKQIVEAIDQFISRYGYEPENRLLIFYSGHGATLTNNNKTRGYIVPKDAPLPEIDNEIFRRRAIDMTYFKNVAERIDSKHVLFVFDSCFSGTIFSAMRGSGKYPLEISEVTNKPVRQFIAAGTSKQTVPDISIFRYGFETAISGAGDLNNDGYITGTELGLYLRGFVAQESRGKQTPQFSRMLAENFNEGDFVFKSPIEGKNIPISKPKAGMQVADIARTYLVGQPFSDCDECPKMVVLPTGQYLMGSPESETGRSDNEGPQKVVKFTTRFVISKFEITHEQWHACFSAGGCSKWITRNKHESPKHPVSNLTYTDALEYTEWLSAKTEAVYRLPTEEEWEYAARSGTTTARWWGGEISSNKAACMDCGSPWDGQSSAPVGSFPANKFDLHDMLGNVWEWVSSCQTTSLETTKHKKTDNICDNQVIRGGSFGTGGNSVRSASRASYPPGLSLPTIGFRVLREIRTR